MRDFHFPGRSEVYASNGMCATSHPIGANVAIDILKRGGTAMDAAIAGALVLGICEPQMTGIGGDLFALVSPAGSNEIHAYNGSGRAPAAANAQSLRAANHRTVPLQGPDAVTIPTAMHAFAAMNEKWGRLGFDALVAPTIHYAEEGVPVAPRVAFDWIEAARMLQGSAKDHYLINGKIPKAGEIFRAPGQAEVLKRVAKHGIEAFYEGEIADDMLNALEKLGGVHTKEDFASVSSEETVPVSGIYKGSELFEHPPNGQGATAILMLNILKHFDISAMDPFGANRVHIEAEAAKLAYDARNRFLADPDHTARLEHMLSSETASQLAGLIDPKRAMTAAAPISEAVHKDTIYITTVDRDGMSVSLIYSIFHGFGSGIASEKFGILLQNRGAGFTLEQGHPNELAGGKRPMHTIIPGMLCENGTPAMPFGVMGGAYQPNGHARFVSNLKDFGMDAQSAIDAPRAFADGGILKVEKGYSDKTRAELADLGHKVEIPSGPIGGAQSIRIGAEGVLVGASDPRKDGCALGF
jgi:gamma-glutamyltranspeptidase/glutathione hydrolase